MILYIFWLFWSVAAQGIPLEFQTVIVRRNQPSNITFGTVLHHYRSLNAYATKVLHTKEIEEHAHTLSVEKDQKIKKHAIETHVKNWGLDRIDQISLPLDHVYHYNGVKSGSGVNIYIVDTGIQVEHPEFNGRASWGVNFVSDTLMDDDGHGTHVAGIAGGSTVGVARNASLIAVKVLDGQGQGYISIVLAGLDWIAQNAPPFSVVNLSIGGGSSETLQSAVDYLLDLNITLVLASGNEAKDTCTSSASCSAQAINVAASDSHDDFAFFSNFGPHVTIIAPGVHIYSSYIGPGAPYKLLSGTSMATPFVTGTVALLQSQSGPYSPNEVIQALQSTLSLPNEIHLLPNNTINRLLYIKALQ